MEVYLLDASFDTIGVIDKCIAFSLAKRYFSPGDFTMKLYGDVKRLNGAAAIYEPISKSCFLIEGIDRQSDGTVMLKGRSLEALLERRILNGRGSYIGNAEESVRLAVERNTQGERALSGIAMGDVTGIEGEGYFRTDFRNLLEFVYETLRPFGASFSLELAGNVPTFKVISGKDRTRSQKKYPPVVFSESMRNVVFKSAGYDLTRYKNTAYVSGSDGRSVVVQPSGDITDRREIYVNGRDIAPSEFNSDEEYLNALRVRGLETLAKYNGQWEYSGTVTDTSGQALSYSLGDICDIDTSFGVTLSERVTSVKYTFEHGKVIKTTVFGEKENSLESVVREINRETL